MGKQVVILILFFLIQFNSYSQNISINNIPCENITYLVKIHDIRRNKTAPFTNVALFNNAFNFLNRMFKEACIQFYYKDVDSIYDYNYATIGDQKDWSNNSELKNLVNMKYEPRVINLFFNNNIYNSTYNGICQGDSAKPVIFSVNPFLASYNDYIFSRQFLNFFGLLPTAYSPLSPEYTDASNGKIVADSIWDTPADPLLIIPSTDTLVEPREPRLPNYFYNFSKKDVNGKYYDPMVSNVMADYPGIKKCGYLTHEQSYYVAKSAIRCRNKKW